MKKLLLLTLALISTTVVGHESTNVLELSERFTPRAKVDEQQGGAWSEPEDWPVLAVHATVLPTGNVFAWDATPDDFEVGFGVGYGAGNYHDSQRNQTRVTVWNPTTNEHVQTFNPDGSGDLFCAGSVHLTDGRIIFSGGDSGVSGKNGASTNSTIYNPWTNRWKSTDDMHSARWYASATSLSNGEILTVGGSYNPETYMEIFNFNEKWRVFDGDVVTSETLSGDYAWLVGASDGSVAYLGPHNRLDKIYVEPIFESDAWVNGPKRDVQELDGRLGSYRGYGSFAMFDKDKVLVSGGGSSSNSSVIIDIKNQTVEQTTPMHYGRRQHNLTVLPDGSVLATGGNTSGVDLYDPNNGILTPEIWSPETGVWTTMNDMTTDRQYHSVALLLPDARVLLAGSGYCIPCFDHDHEEQNAEIFSPPYLFRGERPVLKNVPAAANYNDTIEVNVPGGIDQAHLIKLSSVTHSQSQDQRLVKLELTGSGDDYVIKMPPNSAEAPPSPYMLFVLRDGVPSISSIIQVGQPLVQVDDVVFGNAKPDSWEMHKVKGFDEHTLTVNFNGNVDVTSLHVASGRWPTKEDTFDACEMVENDILQCVVGAQDDSSWYVGVYGEDHSEFSLSFDLRDGQIFPTRREVLTPENFVINQLDLGEYELSWNNVAGADHYEVIRDGRVMSRSTGNNFLDQNLSAMRFYSYSVVAVDVDNNRSNASEVLTIQTSQTPYIIDPTTFYNPEIPSTPVGVRLFKQTADMGALIWERSYDDKGVSGYYIYRNGNLIGERNDSGVSFPQNDLIVGETYTYQVSSYDSDGNQSPKSQPFITTGTMEPTPNNIVPNILNPSFDPVVDLVNNFPVEEIEEPVEVEVEINDVETPFDVVEEASNKKSSSGFLGSTTYMIIVLGLFVIFRKGINF